jgi:hypothetical protein
MTLNDLIEALEELPQDDIIRCGELVSWRGVYAELSLEPGGERVVSDVLDEARRVLGGETRQGWKGGDFTYKGWTPVWADLEGDYTSNALIGIVPHEDGNGWRLNYVNIHEYK